MNLLFKRIGAFFLDYLIVACYGLFLYFIFSNVLHVRQHISPVQAQFLGFFTVTLPVYLYYFLCESSHFRGTIGKLLLQLKVVGRELHTKNSLALRNLLKLVPWEIAHAGVHWWLYYEHHQLPVPWWVWVLAILPQLIMLSYFLSLVFYKGKQTFYDLWSGCIVTVSV
jgi:uncharacterized RDD family membrane protein YckC